MLNVRRTGRLLLGAAGMYFLDPTLGRRRRAVAADRLRSRLERRRRRMHQQAVYEEKKQHGERLRRAGAGRFHRRDDRSVAEHLHQVLEQIDVPTRDVTVEVVGDQIRVRGQVETAEHLSTVLDAVGSEAGGRRVESLLHLPAEPAPNKRPALRASADALH